MVRATVDPMTHRLWVDVVLFAYHVVDNFGDWMNSYGDWAAMCALVIGPLVGWFARSYKPALVTCIVVVTLLGVNFAFDTSGLYLRMMEYSWSVR